jgi:hypothetical protein
MIECRYELYAFQFFHDINTPALEAKELGLGP